ncbi:MAG: hypothetical protein PHY45_10185 [Rhodocyclaceae bacterium]|nr:hypothetical protein [Rhodocyclaceae bacterium]
MKTTTYYATYKLGRRDAEADAIVGRVNDLMVGSGESYSWDATRARIGELADADTQKRLGITIEADEVDAADDD